MNGPQPETHAKPPPFYRGVGLFLALGAAGILAGGVLFYRDQKQRLRREVEQELLIIADAKVAQIQQWRTDRLADAGYVIEDPFDVEEVSKWLAHRAPESAAQILAWFRGMQRHSPYRNISLVDAEGRTLLGLVEPLKPLAPLARQSLALALRERTPVLSDLHSDPATGEPHLDVIAPLWSRRGEGEEALGAVIFSVDAEQFLYPLLQSWPVASQTAETLLVRRENNHVLFLNELRHQTNTALKLRLPLDRSETPAVMAVRGTTGVVTGRDYRGAPVLAVINPVPDSTWFLVAKMDIQEAFAAWRVWSALILAVTVVALAFLLGFSGLLWQRQQRRYHEAFYRSEKALAEKEEQFRLLVEGIKDYAIYLLDQAGRVASWNPGAQKLKGYTADEIIGRHFSIFFQPEDRAAGVPEQLLKEAAARGKIQFEGWRVRKDGSRFWADVLLTALKDERDQLRGFAKITRDATDRRTTEQNLQRANRLYAVSSQVNQAVVRIKDREAFFRTLCEIAVREGRFRLAWIGWSDETTGQVRPIFHEGDDEGYLATIRIMTREDDPLGRGPAGTAVREGRLVVCNDVATDPWMEPWREAALSRGYRSMAAIPFREKDRVVGAFNLTASEPDFFVGEELKLLEEIGAGISFALDAMTLERERSRAEADVRRLVAAISQAAEIVIITDPEGVIEYVNPAFEQITGYSSADALGQNPRILKSGRQDQAFYENLWRTIKGGGIWSGRMINRRKDGTLYYEQATISPVRDEQGRLIHFVAVKRDVTREVELEENLRQFQKLEAIGHLAGGVAHDLNNLLQPILGYGEELLGDTNLTGTQRDSVQEIVKAGERARNLVRQLMAFGRKQLLQIAILDLNAVIQDFNKLLRRVLRENIRIKMALAPTLSPIAADRTQIEQILMNLTINAQEAMPEGGTLTVETSEVELDSELAARHAGVTPGRYVQLVVSDTGIGMDAETRARLFEPFFTTKEAGRGMGLGLSTVYGIVKQHGGHIWVYSEKEYGTTFKVCLPVAPAEQMRGLPPLLETDIPKGTETVLVVEDDPMVQRATCVLVQSLGYKVLAADSPKVCLSVVERWDGPIDLLLTDVVMPEMDGMTLYERVKQVRPEIKVLYMSGYTARITSDRGVLRPDTPYLQKPFTRIDLARKIREVLKS